MKDQFIINLNKAVTSIVNCNNNFNSLIPPLSPILSNVNLKVGDHPNENALDLFFNSGNSNNPSNYLNNLPKLFDFSSHNCYADALSNLPDTINDFMPVLVYDFNRDSLIKTKENTFPSLFPNATNWNQMPHIKAYDGIDSYMNNLLPISLNKITSNTFQELDFLKRDSSDNMLKDIEQLSFSNSEYYANKYPYQTLDPSLLNLNLFEPPLCSWLGVREINSHEFNEGIGHSLFKDSIFSPPNLINFDQLLRGDSSINEITPYPFYKDITHHLQNNIKIVVSSTDSHNLQTLFNGATHNVSYDKNRSIFVMQIAIPERNITSYDDSIKKQNYKLNQGQGGRGKRRAEKEFFISKFNELKGLRKNVNDQEIIELIWKGYQDKDLKNLSYTNGLRTLKSWYKTGIKDEA